MLIQILYSKIVVLLNHLEIESDDIDVSDTSTFAWEIE